MRRDLFIVIPLVAAACGQAYGDDPARDGGSPDGSATLDAAAIALRCKEPCDPKTVATGQTLAGRLAVEADDSAVYWTSGPSLVMGVGQDTRVLATNDTGFTDIAIDEKRILATVSSNGGEVVIVTKGTFAATKITGQYYPSSINASELGVFYAQYTTNGGIYRLDNATFNVAMGKALSGPNPSGLRSDGSGHLVWGAYTEVRRALPDGGDLSVISGFDYYVLDTAAIGEQVFACGGIGVQFGPRGGGMATRLGGAGDCRQMSAEGTHLFWVNADGDLFQGDATTKTAGPFLPREAGRSGVAVTARYVYVANRNAGTIVRYAR